MKNELIKKDMERDLNRNRHSYRARREDSREDYQGANSERRERTERPQRREYFNHQPAGTENRGNDREGGWRRESRYNGEGQRPFRREGQPGDERRRRPRVNEEGRREPREQRAPREGGAFRPRREGGEFRRNHEEREPWKSDRQQERRDYRGGNREERGTRQPRRDYAPGDGRAPQQDYKPGKRRRITAEEREELRQKHYSKKKQLAHKQEQVDENEELRLNRYIAMGGVCSRRDADELIAAGRVKVNGEVVQAVGTKVKRSDTVEVDGKAVAPERKVYLVLNKPKDYVTTMDDPQERKTVMKLLEGACKERIYPVGRLDRQTTGVLLFTNDGDFAKKLTHPKYDRKKIYHVFLDKPLAPADLEQIAKGIELEDGFIKADEIEYVKTDGTEVGIEIHSGKNRIVRRIFEHLGYQIEKLDRVYFAGITKKNLPRGKWRFLTPKEVSMLKAY